MLVNLQPPACHGRPAFDFAQARQTRRELDLQGGGETITI